MELDACYFCTGCKQGNCDECHGDGQDGLCKICEEIRDREEADEEEADGEEGG